MSKRISTNVPFEESKSFRNRSSDGVTHGGGRFGEIAGVGVGGGSDGNFTAACGVPTLDGMGAVGGGAHADHEFVLVDTMVDRARLLAALVERL